MTKPYRWAFTGLLAGAAAAAAIVPRTPADFSGIVVSRPASDFEVRRNCRIGRFGVAPWLKPGAPKDAKWAVKTRQALEAMGVPAAAVERLQGPPDGEVRVGNLDGQFHTTFRSGAKYVTCLDSQTRFADDEQTEVADLYRFEDYHIVVFRVCGNVSRIFPAAPAAPPSASGTPGPPPSLGDAPGPGQAPSWTPGPGGPYEVPEPSTLVLFGLAFAAALWAGRK